MGEPGTSLGYHGPWPLGTLAGRPRQFGDAWLLVCLLFVALAATGQRMPGFHSISYPRADPQPQYPHPSLANEFQNQPH